MLYAFVICAYGEPKVYRESRRSTFAPHKPELPLAGPAEESSERGMLTLHTRYVRLLIEDGMSLEQIPDAFRMALQVCRFNEIKGALLVTAHRDGLMLRAGLRASLRTMMARDMMPSVRLALVGWHPEAMKALQGLKELAHENSIPCEIFRDESVAVEWFAELDDGKVQAIR